MANNRKQTSCWLTYKVQKWHTLPSGFDKQLRNSSTTLRNNLPRNNKSAATTYTKFFSQHEILQPTPDVRCSRFVSHEAESFAQRECDVITARPITRPIQKALRAFASVHRKPTKLGSVLRTQLKDGAKSFMCNKKTVLFTYSKNVFSSCIVAIQFLGNNRLILPFTIVVILQVTQI